MSEGRLDKPPGRSRTSARMKRGRMMRIGRVIASLFGWLAMASVASAAERLVLEPYPGPPWYDVINQGSGVHFIREQMPQGQTPDNFHDLMTAQAVTGEGGSPADFLTNTMADLGRNCETVTTFGPTAAEEAGRQVAYGRIYCGRQKGQTTGAHIFFKVIKGSDAFYIIDRDFKIPGSDHPGAPLLPDDQAIDFLQSEGAATKYLTDKVYLCDPVFPEARCSSEAVPTGR